MVQEDKKNLPVGCDRCSLIKLELAMKLKGFREISAFVRETRLPLDRSFISKILHGHIKPTLEQAQLITNALGLSVKDIFEMSDIRDLDFFGGKNE